MVDYYCVRHGNIISVFRYYEKDGGAYPERWDPGDKRWMSYGTLMRNSSIGSETPYEEATEEEVMEFIKAHY